VRVVITSSVYAKKEPSEPFPNILKKKVMEMSQMNYEYCDGVTHTIKKGDTLYEISRKYNVPLALLLRANPYVDVFNLRVGDTICVPAAPGQMAPYPVSGMPRPNVGRDDGDSQDDDWDDDRDDDRDDDDGRDDYEDREDGRMRRAREEMLEERYREMQPEEVPGNTPGGNWEKYVVQPGDTMADILENMDGDVEEFLERNSPATIYMLPGVVYYIRKSGR